MITWTHINEALPDDDETVLIVSGDGNMTFAYHDAGVWRQRDDMVWRSKDDMVLSGHDLPTRWAPYLAAVRDLPVTRIDPHHAKVRLLLNEITGAGMAVLHAIAKAGGHVIADPMHQAPIAQALRALEKRVQEALDLPAILED